MSFHKIFKRYECPKCNAEWGDFLYAEYPTINYKPIKLGCTNCLLGVTKVIGKDIPKSFEEAIASIYQEMSNVMLMKQKLRGDKNITEQGQLGVVNRMINDKMVRIHRHIEREHLRTSLVKAECPLAIVNKYLPSYDDTIKAESFEDDLLDVANYALILIMLGRGWWGVSLKSSEGGVE